MLPRNENLNRGDQLMVKAGFRVLLANDSFN